MTKKEEAGESSSEEDEGYYWRRASNPEYPRSGREESESILTQGGLNGPCTTERNDSSMTCTRGTLGQLPTEPECISTDTYLPAENPEPEQDMEPECGDTREEQITEDQEGGPQQQEPCGAIRLSLRMTYPYLGQPTFQTLPTLNTVAANSIHPLHWYPQLHTHG